MIQNSARILSILLIALFYGGNGHAESQPFKRVVQERSIISLDPVNIIPDSFGVSPDGRRAAHIVKIGNKKAFVVDGVQQKVYDDIKMDYFGPQFSPDSAKIGYFAREENRWFFVMDGKEEREHRPEATLSVHYSEEGSRYCYVAKGADKHYLVMDGKAGSNEYEQVFPCTFSRDGRRVAFSVREGKKFFWIIDGVKQKEYGVLGSFQFSPDGKRFAYEAHPHKAWSQRGQRWLMVIDGREEKEYWKIHGGGIFSPDGRRTAYAAEPGTESVLKPVVVLDGREIGDESAGFSSPVFSPDGRRIAYMARVYRSGFLVPAPAPSYDFNVVDGKPGKTYDRTSIPVFSPDSRRMAYYGVVNNQYRMVVDGEEGKPYDDIGHPVFAADSHHVGYNARRGEDRFVVVDGTEYPKYEYVSKPVFSPDGKRVCYMARKSGKWTAVIDAAEGPFYDEIYPKRWRKRVAAQGIGFSTNDSFYYFARKGSELIFIQETIAPPDEESGENKRRLPTEPRLQPAVPPPADHGHRNPFNKETNVSLAFRPSP